MRTKKKEGFYMDINFPRKSAFLPPNLTVSFIPDHSAVILTFLSHIHIHFFAQKTLISALAST